MRTAAVVLVLAAACGSTTPSARSTPAAASERTASAPATWRVPHGWKAETIPFPLDFAPALAHRGVEELRFAPGMFDHTAPGYWSYAFAWRLEDPAELDAAALAAELATYFKGLVAAVDTRHRITAIDEIGVVAAPDGDGFRIAIHTFDAFDTAAAIDLAGTARRIPCGTGALWTFALAPASSALRTELDALAAEATCAPRP